ncbi:MAG: PadR family transcriptional regulator [Gemmatimonadota bacterium]
MGTDGVRNMELLQGTLDVLVLKGLAWGPRHGYAIARWIEHVSDHSLQVLDGALYTALHRMEARGWIESQWGISDKGRKAKLYELTAVGRKQLRSETVGWTGYVTAIGKVLKSTTSPA